MKFYNDTDTNNIIGMVPFFLAGTAFNTNDDDMKELLTGNTDEADIFCTHIDRFDSIQTFIDTIQLMKDISNNRDVFWIIEAKDEMVVDWKWEQIKEASKYFRKDRLLLISAEIQKNVSDNIITSFPNKLVPYQYLHHNRDLIPFSFINLPDYLKPNKSLKIISSARKYNPSRDSFYKIFLEKGGEKLMSDDCTFRYHGVTSQEKIADTPTVKYFSKTYKHEEDVSSDRMVNSENDYYFSLLEEYSRYYFALVHETNPKDTFDEFPPRFLPDYLYPNGLNGLQMGEKTLLPMATKTIFFVNSYSNIETTLNELGIETFNFIFDEDYDSLMLDRRSKKLYNIVEKISNLSHQQILEIYQREDVQEKLQKNYEYIFYHRDKLNCRNDHMEFLNSLI